MHEGKKECAQVFTEYECKVQCFFATFEMHGTLGYRNISLGKRDNVICPTCQPPSSNPSVQTSNIYML